MVTRRMPPKIAAVLATLLVLSFAGVAAAVVTPLASTSFTDQYNGDVFPPALPFNDFFQPAPAWNPADMPPATDGDILSWRSNLSADAGGLYTTEGAIVTRWTQEVRYKLDSDFPDQNDPYTNAALQGGAFAIYGQANTEVSFYQNRITIDNQHFVNGSWQSPIVISTQSNTDAFHTVRVAWDAGIAYVWRDGVLIHTQDHSGFPIAALDNLMIMGMPGGNWGGPTTHIDYFRYDKSGAYSPIPTAHAGDFDSDGDVDGADFVAWQTNFPKASGATLAQGDADSDADVDGADFVVWQTNFPFTPGPGAAPVPEPATLALLALGMLTSLMAWRRSR